MLGDVFLRFDDGGLILRPLSRTARHDLLSAVKRTAAAPRLKSDGDDFILDTRVALALRQENKQFPLNWSPEAAGFIDRFAEAYATRSSAIRRIGELQNSGIARQALADYEPRGILDEHQQIAVAAMTDNLITGLCLFDEQGSGKTVMTIHAFDRLVELGKVRSMLIFAPKNMLPVWKADFEKFMGGKYCVQVVSGDRRAKFESLSTPAEVYVTNYETAQSLEAPLRSLLLRNAGQLVMTVDESFFVKNAEAVRSSAIRRLRILCDRCWMLCGTPAPNGAIDVVHQFEIADCGVTFSSVRLPKEPTQLRETIQAVVENRGLYLRRLKHHVLPDLPAKSFERVSIDMDPVQRGLYEEALHGLAEDVVAADERGFQELFTSFLARRMALLQIASNPKLIFPDYREQPPKQKALESLLEELISVHGEKVVLWSFFRRTLDDLEESFSKYGAVRLDGSITDTRVRGEAISRFQNDPNTKLFIANPAAAGAGITLTAARIAIYESFPTQTAHFLQSIDRIHRRGQTRPPHYYFLLSAGSLDEVEYERLLEKDRMGFQLFGDAPPEMHSREFFLKELQDALTRLR